jgi:hypothetical protein
MDHNVPIALENLTSIREALNRTPPDWVAAIEVWKERLDWSISVPLFKPVESFKPDERMDVTEARERIIRSEAEQLRRALEARDRKNVEVLLISIEEKLHVLAVIAAVA